VISKGTESRLKEPMRFLTQDLEKFSAKLKAVLA
jgi:hypothetical protein